MLRTCIRQLEDNGGDIVWPTVAVGQIDKLVDGLLGRRSLCDLGDLEV
jgi:hypothetical protein